MWRGMLGNVGRLMTEHWIYSAQVNTGACGLGNALFYFLVFF